MSYLFSAILSPYRSPLVSAYADVSDPSGQTIVQKALSILRIDGYTVLVDGYTITFS